MNATAQEAVELAPRPARRGRPRAAFGFIFATAAMNSVSFGLMIPVLPNLIRSFFGTLSASSTASAAEWTAIFGVTWGLMQFLSGPVLGMLSDRYGRRPVLLISIFGLAADFVVMALAPSLIWLLVGRVFNGLTAASFSTGNAYVADVSTMENRARNFGWMGAAFGVGFLIGPPLGGFLALHAVHIGALALDPLRTPFLVAAALCTINWFYGLLVLPESLPPERRLERFEWRRANPVGSLALLRARGDLAPLASLMFLYQLSQQVLPNVFVLYTMLRYQWSLSFLTVTMFMTGALGITVQSLVVSPAVRRIGERGAVIVGGAAGLCGYLIYALAPTGWIYFVGMPVFALQGLMLPGLQGLMTRQVSGSEQGRLQGANQSIGGLTAILGPIVFPLTFAWALKEAPGLPGLPILIAAGLLALAVGVAVRFASLRPPLAAVV